MSTSAPISTTEVIAQLIAKRDALQAQRDASTNAARELAKLLTLEQLQGVSKPTAEWIAEQFHLPAAAESKEVSA